MTDEFMERQKTCTHPEWDSKSSPGITFCTTCYVFKVHNALEAFRNMKSVYVPLFLPDPIQTKESSL